MIIFICQQDFECMAHPFPYKGAGSIISGEIINQILKIQVQCNVFGQLVNLVGNHNLTLDAILSYELVVIPWALATPDECLLKKDNSTQIQVLDKQFVLLDSV